MVNIFYFIRAALPWVAMGLLLAIFFAISSAKTCMSGNPDDYQSEYTVV